MSTAKQLPQLFVGGKGFLTMFGRLNATSKGVSQYLSEKVLHTSTPIEKDGKTSSLIQSYLKKIMTSITQK
jgi:hypothetical protein